ncbi:MAG TPA: flippase [Solirubrobacterales bacterium]|nr:flippase [Solirubrobacterales bacterium]
MATSDTHATKVGSRRVVTDIVIQLGGQVVNIALGIVTTVVIVRALGASRYGEWATILATIELIATVGNLGLETVAVRLAAQEPEREGAWVGATTGLRLLIAIPMLAAFVVALAVLASDDEMLVTGLILSLLYITAAISTLRIIFRLHVRNHITVAFTTANSILWAGSVIAIAAVGGSMVAFAVAFLAVSIVIQGALAVLALRTIHVRWRGARKLWPRLLKIGVSVGIAGTLTFTYGRIDQILVYELASNAADVGVYAAMYKILDNAGFVPMALMVTLFPIMAGLFPADPPRLRRMMQMAIDYLMIVALGGLALTIVAAEPIVELLYGPDYVSGSTVLTILIAAFIPICIGNVAGNMVVAMDLQRRYIWFAALGLVFNVGLNLILIPKYGIEAAAWVTLLTEVVVVSLSLWMVLRKIELRLSLLRMGLALLAAVVSALAVWGLREAGAGAIVLILAMTALYPALLIAFRALDLDELRRLLRNRKAPEPV